jgi:hypothetical protein
MFLANIITFHCYGNIAEVFVELGNNITYAPSNVLLLETQPSQYIKLYWLLCTVNDLLIHYMMLITMK